MREVRVILHTTLINYFSNLIQFSLQNEVIAFFLHLETLNLRDKSTHLSAALF